MNQQLLGYCKKKMRNTYLNMTLNKKCLDAHTSDKN